MKANGKKNSTWLVLATLSLILAFACLGWTGFAFADELAEEASSSPETQTEVENDTEPAEVSADEANASEEGVNEEATDEATLYTQATEHRPYLAIARLTLLGDNPTEIIVDPDEQFGIRVRIGLNSNSLWETWPVSEGDTTTIEIPKRLKLVSTDSFECRDADGNLVANATVSDDAKTITLTYTDFVEDKSDVKSQFDIYVKLDESITPVPDTALWEVHDSAIMIYFNNSEDETSGNTITINKQDSEGNPLEGATFSVTPVSSETAVGTITTGKDGSGSLKNLADETYVVKETRAPENYEMGSETEWTVKPEDFVDGVATLTLVNNPAVTSVSVTKVWDDDENRDGIRPSDITFAEQVHLYADGTEVTDVLPRVTDNGDDTYSITWENLPKAHAGKAITYTVTEDDADNDGYTPDTTEVAADGTMTNSHTPEVTSVSITTIWDDAGDYDGIRPSVEKYASMIHLSNGAGEITDVAPSITCEDNSTYVVTWEGLPKNCSGHEVTYSIGQDVIEGYETDRFDVDNKGTIVNKHISEAAAAESLELLSSQDPEPSAPTTTQQDSAKAPSSTSAQSSGNQTSTKPGKLPQTDDITATLPMLTCAVAGVGGIVAGYRARLNAKRRHNK